MNATIRYENASAAAKIQSTVVILKDGRAMEVRRGETTDFSAPGPGSARLFWPSMAAWVAQLGPWPSVETWRSSLAAPLPPHPDGKPVTIRTHLAYFLGKTNGITKEGIRDALNSYIASKWGLNVYRTKRDVPPPVKQYRLDDFLVTLSGLHPEGLYTARQILNAVLAQQIIRKPLDHEATSELQKDTARLYAEFVELQEKIESLKTSLRAMKADNVLLQEKVTALTACLRVIKATCGSV